MAPILSYEIGWCQYLFVGMALRREYCIIHYMKSIFKEINCDIFNGELEMPIFSAYEYDAYGAYSFCYNQDYININIDLCISYDIIFATIAHEMCHMAQYHIQGKRWSRLKYHGLDFTKEAKKVSKFYNIPLENIL